MLLPLTADEIDAGVRGAVDEVEQFLAARAAAIGVTLPLLDL